MLCADAMPRSHNVALQEGESRLDGVRMNVTVYIDAALVLNRLVLGVHARAPHCIRVGRELISDHNFHVIANVLSDDLGQRAGLCILDVEEAEIAVTLSESDHDFLGFLCSVNTLADLLSADVGLIHFDGTVQHGLIFHFLHSGADAVAEVPSGFVADSQCSFHLVRGETFSRFHHQQDGRKPLVQRQVGIVKDRAGENGELIEALATLEDLPRFDVGTRLVLAARAFNTIRPTQFRENLAALLVG